MGSASSKAMRQFPKHAAPPTWPGARTPMPPPPHADAKANIIPRASESRTAAIEEDAKDPHLAANLTRLGAVRVDHNMQTFMVGQANRTFQSRLQSEQQASSSQGTRNRIVAAALMDLLDAKKALSATDSNGLQALAEKYNIDLEKLQRVSQYVNSPTVDPESVVRKVNEDGSERTTMKAIWVDPPA